MSQYDTAPIKVAGKIAGSGESALGIDAISNQEEKEDALAAKRKRGDERKKAERARKKMAIDDIRDPKLKEAAMAAAKKNKSEQNKKYQKKRKAMVG